MAVTVCVLPTLSVMVSVTVLPGAASVVPERVGVVSLSEPGALMVMVGAVVSISPVVSAVAVLPASSVTLALTVNSPSANSAGTSALYVPSACTTAVTVWVLPALSVMVNVTVLPGAASVMPDRVGVVSLSVAIASIVIDGAVVSISPVVSAVAVLPASSVTLALTVNSPSANSAGTSALYVPSACTMAVTVCVLPALSVMVNVTVLPGAASVVPDRVGVVSLSEPGALMVIVGAVASISPVVELSAVLPVGSSTVASTVNSPSANAFGTSALNVPSPCTIAVTVWIVPALSVTVSVTVLPGIAEVIPDKVGVVSLVKPIASRVREMSCACSPVSENSTGVTSSLSFAF